MSDPVIQETTIRDDTTARHLRKYENKNPIHQLTLGRFFDAVADELKQLNPQRVLEFGCGEGLFLDQLRKRGVAFPSLTGIDLREDALEHARSLMPEYDFKLVDVFAFEPEQPFDLVIASQVFEHLPDPVPFLKRLCDLGDGQILLTVPLEPWFRMMNLVRGRDILRLGNHPEHVNHWGVSSFRKFLEPHVEVEAAWSVFPFVISRAKIPHEKATHV